MQSERLFTERHFPPSYSLAAVAPASEGTPAVARVHAVQAYWASCSAGLVTSMGKGLSFLAFY